MISSEPSQNCTQTSHIPRVKKTKGCMIFHSPLSHPTVHSLSINKNNMNLLWDYGMYDIPTKWGPASYKLVYVPHEL